MRHRIKKRNLTISSCPLWAAPSNGVKLPCCSAFASAPAASRMVEISKCRLATAECSGIICWAFLRQSSLRPRVTGVIQQLVRVRKMMRVLTAGNHQGICVGKRRIFKKQCSDSIEPARCRCVKYGKLCAFGDQ